MKTKTAPPAANGHLKNGDSRGNNALPKLVEDARMCGSLRQVIAGFTRDRVLQEDLMQECLVCLWNVEAAKPGRTRSWYLQNCRFHVQHWLALGRSVDSPKRSRGDNRIPLHGTEVERALPDYHTNGDLFDLVSVQDLVSTLALRLSPSERDVLHGLADGFVLREIAFKSGLSYPTALKHRRKIAALTAKLGIAAPRQAGNECDQPV